MYQLKQSARRPAATLGLILANGLLLAGCTPQQAPARADFRSGTTGKVPAIVGAADQDDADTLFELVHALSDKDPAVRLFAIQSLETRTGQTLGYRYYESTAKRRDAVTRWRDWLMQAFAPPPPENSPENPPAADQPPSHAAPNEDHHGQPDR